MTEFKVGDRVRRIIEPFVGIRVGDEDTILDFRHGGIVLKDRERFGGYSEDYFELVEPVTKVLTVDEKLDAAKQFMDKRLGTSERWSGDIVAIELSDATGNFVALTQRSYYTLSDAQKNYDKHTEAFNAWFDKHVAPTLTNKEEIVSDLYDSDGNAITLDAYNPALLPLFTKLAEEADRKGYCREYDAIAAVAGVPSRAEIKELNKPPVPTHGLEAFRALETGVEFQFERATGSRYKINDAEYVLIEDGTAEVYKAEDHIFSDSRIEKVTR